MRVNICVESYSMLKYVGCSSAAMMLYEGLKETPGVEVELNSRDHDHDIYHCHTFGPRVNIDRIRSKGVTILTAHSTPRLNIGNLAAAGLINLLYPPIYRRFDHMITITKPSTLELQEMLPGMPMTQIPNCIDMKKFAPSAEKRREFREFLGVDDDAKVILTVAQQTPRKGIFDFLWLAKRMPEYTFVWVGGYAYGKFSTKHKQIDVEKAKAGDNVIFTGFVPDITGVYCGADLLFVPSYGEIMSVVVLEGLASGVPVISRDLPEFRDVFDGIAGFFSDIDGAESLIRNEEVWRRAASTSRESVEKFNLKNVAQMHADLYAELLA